MFPSAVHMSSTTRFGDFVDRHRDVAAGCNPDPLARTRRAQRRGNRVAHTRRNIEREAFDVVGHAGTRARS